MTDIIRLPDHRPADIPAVESRTSIGKLLAGPYLAAVTVLDRRLRDAGHPEVRPAHGTVLQVIDAEGSRVTELAARAGMTKQAMTELVTHLERAGYLERAPDPADGRAKLVRLTRRGWECIAAARAIIGEIEAEWAERHGRARMTELRSGLEALNAAVAAEPAWGAGLDLGHRRKGGVSVSIRYWPNPAHKRGTTEAGPPQWRPDKEPCPDDMTVAERDELLAAAVPLDADDARSRRYNVRRTDKGLEMFEAKWTRDVDGEPEFHGHPTFRVPCRVLRVMRDDGRITTTEYRRLIRDLG